MGDSMGQVSGAMEEAIGREQRTSISAGGDAGCGRIIGVAVGLGRARCRSDAEESGVGGQVFLKM